MAYDNFPWGQIFDKGLRIRTGQCPVQSCIDELMGLISDDKIRVDDIITHTPPLGEAPKYYDIFDHKQDGCVKVVMKA